MAAAEKINSSYVSRLLRLTLLAPDIVEAILDRHQLAGVTVPWLMAAFPLMRHEQTAPLPSEHLPVRIKTL
jgi:hypothetical protein